MSTNQTRHSGRGLIDWVLIHCVYVAIFTLKDYVPCIEEGFQIYTNMNYMFIHIHMELLQDCTSLLTQYIVVIMKTQIN